MQKANLFLSSTVSDLRDFRSYATTRLLGHSDFDLKAMGGQFDWDLTGSAWKTSLDQIEKCQAFVGIVGARYGTIPPNQSRSITHMEFDRALALSEAGHLQVELLAARPEAIRVPVSSIEDDHKRSKRDRWLQELENRTQFSYFDNYDDFTHKFNRALENLAKRVAKHTPPPLFSVEEAKKVIVEADHTGKRRENRVSQVIRAIARQLEPLFYVDDKFISDSPFLGRIREDLHKVVFDIDYDSQRSSLSRAGIPHVLVRVETLVSILRRLPQADLEIVGTEIGLGAARDFCKHFLISQRMPASLAALLEALNQWDQTGGWGQIELLQESSSKTTIRVRNHFLVVNDIEETHRLCSFWAGYLKGFLTHSLIHFDRELDLRNDAALDKNSLPRSVVPFSVKHLNDADKVQDEFDVDFRARPDREVRRQIGTAIRGMDSDPSYARQTFKSAAKSLNRHEAPAASLSAEMPAPIDNSVEDRSVVRLLMTELVNECDRQLENQVRTGRLTREPSIRSFADLTRQKRTFERPLVLFSGGLDGAYLLKHLTSVGFDNVVALTVDLGNDIDTELARETCRALGIEWHHVNYTEKYITEFVQPSIWAYAMYLGLFPVHATLSRPALAQCAVLEATQHRCDAIIHTATASQNSLRRFNGALAFYLNEAQFGSPFEFEEIKREKKRADVVAGGLSHYQNRSFSIDSSIYGIAFESETLDDPESFDFKHYPTIFKDPRAPEGRHEILKLHFDAGRPAAINGKRMPLAEILRALKNLGNDYGLGWYSGLEENASGQKVHEVRVMPAAEVLLKGYRYLEAAILSFDEIQEKMRVEQVWLREATEGRWFGTTKHEAEKVICAAAQRVSGEVDIEVRRHLARPVAVRAASALYARSRRD